MANSIISMGIAVASITTGGLLGFIYALGSLWMAGTSIGEAGAAIVIDKALIDELKELADTYHASLEQSLKGCKKD